MNDEKWVPIRKASDFFGVSKGTLRNWDEQGKVVTKRTSTGQRMFLISGKVKKSDKIKVCYCRVSSAHQKDDLKRQIEFMQSKFPEHEIWSDVGSGINWKRHNFNRILECAKNGTVQEIVVAHRDRLCRFAFELVENVLELHQVKLVVLDDKKFTCEEELADDLLSIVQVFVAKRNGKRRYKKDK